MSERPRLSRQLDSGTFREYYYLKEELMDFCRENGLPVSGGKTELTERIALFLDTGIIKKPSRAGAVRNTPCVTELTGDTLIEEGFVCSEKHRAFFKAQIGESFKFNVAFQKWLKANAGKTYSDAVAAYHAIAEEKRSSKSRKEIDSQFEYNTYIRDFFADNEGKTLTDAIICWKYKKSLRGHNRYERSDLAALDTKRT